MLLRNFTTRRGGDRELPGRGPGNGIFRVLADVALMNEPRPIGRCETSPHAAGSGAGCSLCLSGSLMARRAVNGESRREGPHPAADIFRGHPPAPGLRRRAPGARPLLRGRVSSSSWRAPGNGAGVVQWCRASAGWRNGASRCKRECSRENLRRGKGPAALHTCQVQCTGPLYRGASFHLHPR